LAKVAASDFANSLFGRGYRATPVAAAPIRTVNTGHLMRR
jgi:hypothetical protein